MKKIKLRDKSSAGAGSLIVLTAIALILTISLLSTYVVASSKDLQDDYVINYELISNTDQCLIDCSLQFAIYFNKDLSVSDSSLFKAKFTKGMEANDLVDWGFRIRDVETYDETVPEYGICNETRYYNYPNMTKCPQEESVLGQTESTLTCEYSYKCQTGSHTEQKQRYVWNDFDPMGKTFKADQVYVLELWGKKYPTKGSNNIDAIPVILDYDLPYAWWNSSWDYRVPLQITLMDTDNATHSNLFTSFSIDLTTLKDEGKLRSDLGDLRLVNGDGAASEIDFLALQPQSGNASIWFDFTNTSSSTETWYLYYGNPSATRTEKTTLSQFSNVDGEIIDSMTTGQYPDTWTAAADGVCTVVEKNATHWAQSGSSAGNKSVYCNNVVTDGRLFGALYEGRIRMVFNQTDGYDRAGEWTDASTSNNLAECFASYGGASQFACEGGTGVKSITGLSEGTVYIMDMRFDENEWLLTLKDASSGNTVGAISDTWKVDNGGYISRNRKFSGYDLRYDEHMIITTGGIWIDPEILVGEECMEDSADENQARFAIEQAILSVLPNALIYTDQQIYTVNATNNQMIGTFDKVAVNGDQRWAFNYVTGSESYTMMGNLTPAFYMWENEGIPLVNLGGYIEDFINETMH